MRRAVAIPITSDRQREGREFFRVHLRETPGSKVRIGELAQTTVTLVDDD
jgi:hypothetical protein